jgi:hypothetical protein
LQVNKILYDKDLAHAVEAVSAVPAAAPKKPAERKELLAFARTLLPRFLEMSALDAIKRAEAAGLYGWTKRDVHRFRYILKQEAANAGQPVAENAEPTTITITTDARGQDMPDGSESQSASAAPGDRNEEEDRRSGPGKPVSGKRLYIEAIPLSVNAKDAVKMVEAAGFGETTLSTIYTTRSNKRLREERGQVKRKPAPVPTSKASQDKLGHGAKRAFVETLPDTTPVQEVIQAAAAAGIEVSEAYIKQMRRNARRLAELGAVSVVPSPSASKALARRPQPLAAQTNGASDKLALLKSLILDVGLDQARHAFDEFEALSGHIRPPQERKPW